MNPPSQEIVANVAKQVEQAVTAKMLEVQMSRIEELLTTKRPRQE